MPTAEKVAIVEEYTDKFKKANAIYIANYSGIDVATVTEVRKKFRENKVEYKVLKKRLAKLAMQNANVTDMDEFLNGVNVFVMGYDDPVLPAKIFEEFNKKNELLEVKAVLFEGKVFAGEHAKAIAKLPTRDALMSQLVGMLQQPMQKLAATLQSPLQKVVGALNALKDKKE